MFTYTLFFVLILFLIGVFGVFAIRKNMLVILMSIEVMLLSGTFLFSFFSVYVDDIIGQLFSLFILTVAAAESAIGLALIVIHYRHKSIISIDSISFLKG
jgi:NADH-quinone oxidoreductase subunit K